MHLLAGKFCMAYARDVAPEARLWGLSQSRHRQWDHLTYKQLVFTIRVYFENLILRIQEQSLRTKLYSTIESIKVINPKFGFDHLEPDQFDVSVFFLNKTWWWDFGRKDLSFHSLQLPWKRFPFPDFSTGFVSISYLDFNIKKYWIRLKPALVVCQNFPDKFLYSCKLNSSFS